MHQVSDLIPVVKAHRLANVLLHPLQKFVAVVPRIVLIALERSGGPLAIERVGEVGILDEVFQRGAVPLQLVGNPAQIVAELGSVNAFQHWESLLVSLLRVDLNHFFLIIIEITAAA